MARPVLVYGMVYKLKYMFHTYLTTCTNINYSDCLQTIDKFPAEISVQGLQSQKTVCKLLPLYSLMSLCGHKAKKIYPTKLFPKCPIPEIVQTNFSYLTWTLYLRPTNTECACTYNIQFTSIKQ